MKRCLVDGEPASTIPLDDRGVQYGDGLFETLAVHSGEIHFLERHLTRLSESCKRLGFPALDWSDIRNEVSGFVDNGVTGVLKLTLTRGSSQRGFASDDRSPVRRILCFSDYPQWPDEPSSRGVCAKLCQMRLASQPQLAGMKHLNRLEQVLARREWQGDAIREGLLSDMQGNMIEGTMSNLFFVSDGLLKTPRLEHCGVAGVMRSVIIDLASEGSIPLEIGEYSRQDVQQADELFVCNSLIGIWPLVKIDTLGEYPVGTITCRLQYQLQHCSNDNNNTWYAT
ncbi:Aminodeoxychorismate lyase [hydrothermal vent metagenome]|uniref:aminodeoxychorismate lyase n=1 Tax=hydrothermal vent metagenome TaxID=652676 RepID=A0A3B0YFL0_9ZZZZ